MRRAAGRRSRDRRLKRAGRPPESGPGSRAKKGGPPGPGPRAKKGPAAAGYQEGEITMDREKIILYSEKKDNLGVPESYLGRGDRKSVV